MRRLLWIGAPLALVCLAGLAGASTNGESHKQITLSTGDRAFWTGPFVASARVDSPGLCGVEGRCYSYPIRVASAGAKALRVGIDEVDPSNGWTLELIDPAGRQVASESTYEEAGVGERYDAEAFAHRPKPGLWKARLIPNNVSQGQVRLRAKLEPRTGTQAPTGKARPELPNLVPDPVWDLTFDQPLPQVETESGNVTALVGVHHPTAQVAGENVYPCLPEETVEQGAKRCLRFSSGMANAGPGLFEVYGLSKTPAPQPSGPLFQVIHRTDGTTYDRRAGSYEFHPVHLHYHVLGIAQFDLYRVAAHRHLVHAGRGLKEGFCLGNSKIFDWHTFGAQEIDPKSIDNCEPQVGEGLASRFYEGVAIGWEDVYTWDTSGQYVDFGANPNGRYVLRMTLDPAHEFLESNYSDNYAYTYFRVDGNDVTVIERGRGKSPWDPNKLVLDPTITR